MGVNVRRQGKLTRELIFMVSRLPPDFGVETEGPCRIKVSDDADSNPVVAFASEELGHQLIVGRKLEKHCALAAFSALSPDCAKDTRARRILFFDRPEHVTRYLEDGEHFDFEKHILAFRDAERRLAAAS